MDVTDLLVLLEKVQHKEAKVFLGDSSETGNVLDKVIIEHDLYDDEIVVVLKPERFI